MWPCHCHGRTAGFYSPIFLPGRKKGLCVRIEHGKNESKSTGLVDWFVIEAGCVKEEVYHFNIAASRTYFCYECVMFSSLHGF